MEGVARRPFTDGVRVTGSRTEAQNKTAELLTANTRTLFQPVFEKDGLFAAIDVLRVVTATLSWTEPSSVTRPQSLGDF